MESAAKIRRKVLRDGRSIRSVSRETGLSRNTIRKYLKDSLPPSYQRQADPVRHKLCDFEDRLRALFDQDLTRPRRERRTGVKLYELLVQEGYGLRARKRRERPAEAEIGRRVNRLLDLTQLPDIGSRYPSQLSGG